VKVIIGLAGNESMVFENVLKKEESAKIIANEVIKNIKDFEKEHIMETKHEKVLYSENFHIGKDYTLYNADSCVKLKEFESESIDLSIYSPPFASLFTYSNSDRDLGNCGSQSEFIEHIAYFGCSCIYRLFCHGDLKHCIYWASAATLTICVTI